MAPSALGDLRVIDASGPIGHYAGRLLADLGADVINVEPPEGDPTRAWPPFLPGVDEREDSLQFILLNANKRGACIDLRDGAGRERFLRLVATADVVIESWRPGEAAAFGLTHDELMAVRPGLIHASITGWGLTGPRSEWLSADIVGVAASGVMALAGSLDGPPQRLPDQQGHRCASLAAAAGILTALHHRDQTGEGQLVEVSMQEALSMAQQNAMPTADILGTSIKRRGDAPRLGFVMPGLGLYECVDGHVYAMLGGVGSGFGGLIDFMAETNEAGDLQDEPYAAFIDEWLIQGGLVALMADPDRAEEGRRLLDHVETVLQRFMGSHTKAYLYEEGQRRRISIGMVSTPADISDSPQLAARDWFVEIDDPGRGVRLRYPGPPARLAATPATLRRPAPLLGEHDAELDRELAAAPAPPATAARAPAGGPAVSREGPRPLEGLRVLDLSWFGAGPIAVRALASAGADVIRIETEKRPDGLRSASPRPPGAQGYNLSGYYNNFNNEKRSVAIDLTTARGRELGIELVRWADVLLTNMTSRAVERIGMTWEAVSKANPGIIAVYQPMQGLTGPHADFLGFGAVLCTICGANYLLGDEHDPPAGPGTSYPDFVVNPLHAVIALMAAVRHKQRTGEGQLVDMSQLESAVAAMSNPLFAYDNGRIEYRRQGNRVPWAAPHGAYHLLGEDRWLAVACMDEQQWQRLAMACEHAEWADDPRFVSLAARKANEDELDALIGGWAAAQDGPEAMQMLQAAGVPASVVQEALDVLGDEHLAARNYFVHPHHAEAGRRAHDGTAWRLSRTPVEVRGPSPLLGEHTYEICTEILDLTPDEISDLVARGVLA